MSYRRRSRYPYRRLVSRLDQGVWVVLTSPLWLGALWLLGEIGKALGWHR